MHVAFCTFVTDYAVPAWGARAVLFGLHRTPAKVSQGPLHAAQHMP